MPSATLNEIHEEEGMVVIPLEEQPPQINHPVLFIIASLFLQDLCARGVAALHGLAAILGRLLPEDGVVLPQINHPVLFIRASLFLQDLCARGVTALQGLAAILGRLLPEDGVVLPQPTLNYIISYLLAFIAIKAQSHPHFPYITHHKSVLAAVICVVMFGFASAAEYIAMRVGDQPPVLKGVARTGRMLCLFLFVIILTYLSCF